MTFGTTDLILISGILSAFAFLAGRVNGFKRGVQLGISIVADSLIIGGIEEETLWTAITKAQYIIELKMRGGKA